MDDVNIYDEIIDLDAQEISVVSEEKPGKGKRIKKKRGGGIPVFIALIVTIIAILAVIYGVGYVYFDTHFLPGIYADGLELSYKSVDYARELILRRVKDYSLELVGKDEDGTLIAAGTINSDDIDMTFADVDTELLEILLSQNKLLWFKAFLTPAYNNHTIESADISEAKLGALIDNLPVIKEGHERKSENAYISEYDRTSGAYLIIPEKKGLELDRDKVYDAVYGALKSLRSEPLNLEVSDCYIEPVIFSDNERLIEECSKINRWISKGLKLDFNGIERELAADDIRKFIVNNEAGDGIPDFELSDEAILEYVEGVAKETDTFGQPKKFVTVTGVELTLQRKSYGWRTDREKTVSAVKEAIEDGTERIEAVYEYRGYASGQDDVGDSYVEADLTGQHLYLHMNGEIIFDTDFVSGNIATKNATPEGIFGITYKTTDAILRGRDYATPVSFWMPFFGNYGMHDATWRDAFGGNIYMVSGSHGCINLPLPAAATIYEYMKNNFPVVCYYYGGIPVPSPDDTGEEVITPNYGGEETVGIENSADD